EFAGELHGVRQGFFSVVERVLKTVAQRAVDCGDELRPKRAADGVASQRQRQPSHLLPPAAQVDDAMQAGFVVRQLAFMDDKSSFVLALEHLRNNLVEGHDFSLDPGSKKLQREI